MYLDRRQLLKVGAAGLLAAALPAPAAEPTRKRRIGHTGITWGYAAQNAPQAIADVGRLGYHGFEPFGSVLDYWESRGGLQDVLQTAGVPLIGAYLPLLLTDAAKRADEVAKAVKWGKLIKKYGGSIAVLGPDNVERDKFDFKSVRATIIASLEAIAGALHDVGITGALHQHTGSCVMTRDELYAVMSGAKSGHVKLCPDTGELLAAGVDPLQTVKDFLPQIAHVHLKDWNDGGDHDGYCPLGEGRVQFAPILDVLETATHPFMLMAELNPAAANATRPDKRSAGELAAATRANLVSAGYRI